MLEERISENISAKYCQNIRKISYSMRCILQRTIDKYSACVEVGKLIDENSACVEVGTTHKHLRRGDKSNNFKNYFSSNDITCEENKKIELAKLQLAKLEKEIELQLAKNKALSLNPAAKVEEKQFETNIENMIKSIKTLSLPVPTRSENFNLFFQSLERAFLTKKINDEYKSEILINLLGERAHNVLLYIKEEELNDYEKLKSIVLREFQITPRECLNSFKNAVKSSGETYIQFAARLTANFQYYCSLRKVNSFESLCDLIISDKLFETLNKETATHIGIREAEDWFRPIDLAKECDIYISSRSGSHKEIPITYGYTQDPFKNRSQNFKPKVKENYPQYLERENKNCFICGDSSHCARDCEKRFKPKESNDHIHNRINVNTLKIESEKQNSDECANLQYVNIFVENQPVTALIDSGCQIPVLNSSLIRVQTPSEEIITLSSCFGEQRMVEVKPINISLNQHSPSLSVGTAISPTLTEEFIIHPSVYSEIEKLGHAKSDVLLSESGSSLSADLGVQFNSSVSFPNVSVSNVIKNCSYDLPYVINFNTRNDSSSLIKDYKCNKIKITKLKLSIVREKCSDIVLCKKANGAMKTSSVEFISRSPNPLPMKSKHHRFVLLRRIFQPWQWKRRKKRNRFEQTSRTLQRKISMRSTKDQLIKKDVLMPVKNNVFSCGTFRMSKRFSSGLHGNTAADSVQSEWPLWHAAKSNAVFARRRIEMKQKLLDIRAEKERSSEGERERYVTMDGTWIYYYMPESKRSLAVWTAAGKSRPKLVQPSAGKVMASVFSDAHEILFIYTTLRKAK
ncbi:transposon Tf2-6 polyprotein [Trichonephila clavipes]|nr:transposon Tf2-6 polyprotein [Trichonephila clavipes]